MGKELSLVLIKPDGIELSLTGEVLMNIEQHGIILAGSKVINVSVELATLHYYEHKSKPFFKSIVNYLMGKYHKFNHIHAFVFYGDNVCKKIREIVGPTNPLERAHQQKITTIRQKYGRILELNDDKVEFKKIFENVVHASESRSAEYEIKIWFNPEEILPQYRIYETKKIIFKNEKGDILEKLIWKKSIFELQKELFD